MHARKLIITGGLSVAYALIIRHDQSQSEERQQKRDLNFSKQTGLDKISSA